MNSLITSMDELSSMPIGSSVFKVEKNDVREYRIACMYPSEHLKSILITYGTNDGCSQWISKINIETGTLFKDYDDAVDKLIATIECDLEAVKRIYKKEKI